MPRALPTVPVWFLSAVAIVVVLVVGMWMSYNDPSGEVDALEVGTYPDGARVALEGPGTLVVHVGRKDMGPGWFGVGDWRYTVTFDDGGACPEAPLPIVDKHDLVVTADASSHTCTVGAAAAKPR